MKNAQNNKTLYGGGDAEGDDNGAVKKENEGVDAEGGEGVLKGFWAKSNDFSWIF